jgi:hypothetical protein
MRMTLEVSEDDFFRIGKMPGIVGPPPGDHGSGWLLYLPGQTPCLCDDFDGAAEMMRKWLARRRR